MKTDIYNQHEAAFAKVKAYVVCDNKGNRVATCAFKFGNAVTCFFHVIGIPMTKGRAGGGGYDRQSAAAWDAIQKAKITDGASPDMLKLLPSIKEALSIGSEGSHWDRALQDAGYKVFQAV